MEAAAAPAADQLAAHLSALVDGALDRVLAHGKSTKLLYDLRILQEEQTALRATLEVDEAEVARLWGKIGGYATRADSPRLLAVLNGGDDLYLSKQPR